MAANGKASYGNPMNTLTSNWACEYSWKTLVALGDNPEGCAKELWAERDKRGIFKGKRLQENKSIYAYRDIQQCNV